MQRLLPLFSAKSPAILEKWLDILLGSYSPQKVQFLKKEKDPFSNPVVHQLSRGLGDLSGRAGGRKECGRGPHRVG